MGERDSDAGTRGHGDTERSLTAPIEFRTPESPRPRVAASPRPGSPTPSFVSLLVRTTGRRPWRDRITELAAVRVVDGRIEASYATTLGYQGGPRRRYDEWGGMDDPAEAPTFAAVEPALRAFLAAWPLVGPDVRLHLAHLAYELSRLNHPGLSNPALDLASLASLDSNSPAPRQKPSLSRLAETLGLPPARPGDLLSEARLAARVALRLVGRLDRGTCSSIEALITTADAERARPLLQPLHWAHLPATPGVYVLRDAREQPLYVGKANDLRRRVGSYLGHITAATRRLDGLAEATARVETIATDSELEAILLEAKLIRALRPPYNVQRRIRPPRLFLRLHLAERAPRLAQRATIAADGATYLGPFRSATAALRARRLASAVFALDSGRHERGNDTSRAQLQEALLFLTGARETAVARLRAEMRRAAQAHDQAGVARARELLGQVLDFSLQDAALSMAPHADAFLVFDGRQAFLIHAARLVRRVEAESLDTARRLLAPEIATLDHASPPGALDDEAHLVLRWLATRDASWQVVRV